MKAILALSTSTPRGSVALVGADGVVAGSYVDLQGHAERLFQAIDEVLARAGLGRTDLTALACDVGPGSFTGVRVGVASAKGVAFGLSVPLAGVTSLEAMAAAAFGEGAAPPDAVVLAALDAKKGELFVAAYDASGRAVLEPCARPAGPGALELPGERALVVVGEAAALAPLPSGARAARGAAFDLPDAAWIGRLAVARGFEGADADAVEPFYVRGPDVTLPGPPAGRPG